MGGRSQYQIAYNYSHFRQYITVYWMAVRAIHNTTHSLARSLTHRDLQTVRFFLLKFRLKAGTLRVKSTNMRYLLRYIKMQIANINFTNALFSLFFAILAVIKFQCIFK